MEYKMRRREEVSPTTTFWKNITYMNQWKARLCRVGGRCRVGERYKVRWREVGDEVAGRWRVRWEGKG